MIVVCPNCSTRFNLPDEQAKAGARLRCSVCKHVFPLPAAEEPAPLTMLSPLDESGTSLVDKKNSFGAEKKKSSGWIGWLLGLVLVLAAGTAFLYFSPPASFDPFHRLKASAEKLADSLLMADVRQYPVKDNQAGPLMVIEGKVVNNSASARELIRVEASLYSKDGTKLASKEQLAGNTASLLQLQVMSEQDLEAVLTNKLGVLANNTNIAPGGEVPFMIVFFNPPKEAAEYGVKVLEARMPPVDR